MERMDATEHSEKYHEVLIVDRQDHSEDHWTIRIRAEEAFPFRPGQYATLGMDVEGRILERPYSIVSSPEEPELEFFIELIPGGVLTPHLFGLGEGDRLLMRKRPKGIFMRQGLDPERGHLFVATVTGIAPFASMLRQLARVQSRGEGEPPRIMLVQGASFSWEFGYAREMAALCADLPGFEYVSTISRPWGDPGWEGETGRAEDVLRKYSDRFEAVPGKATVYLCGHPGMIANARGIMRRRGLEDADILEEQYWPEGKAPGGAA